MRNFGRTNQWKNLLASRAVLVFLGIVFLIFAWNVFGLWGKMRETSRNREMVENKINDLKQEKEELSFSITTLKTEEGIEENIRDRYGFGKEGEGLIVIVDEDKAEVPLEANTGGF